YMPSDTHMISRHIKNKISNILASLQSGDLKRLWTFASATNRTSPVRCIDTPDEISSPFRQTSPTAHVTEPNIHPDILNAVYDPAHYMWITCRFPKIDIVAITPIAATRT